MNAEQIKQRQEEATARKALRKTNAKVVAEAILEQYKTPISYNDSQNLQFFHAVAEGRTYAVIPPDADELRTAAMKLLGGGSEVAVNIKVGIARVNAAAGDVYNRKVGRAVSTYKLTGMVMRLKASQITEGRQAFYLELDNLHIHLHVEKKLFPKFIQAFEV